MVVAGLNGSGRFGPTAKRTAADSEPEADSQVFEIR
jgi:hypothetical protein